MKELFVAWDNKKLPARVRTFRDTILILMGNQMEVSIKIPVL